MNKLEKIALQEQKMREKIAAMQAILKQIDGQRTEQENLQIVQQVRALKLTRDELYAFINGGELPASLAGAISSDTPPEPVYSRRGKSRRHESETQTPDGEPETTTFEREGINNEE